jgi:hypothetical protein
MFLGRLCFLPAIGVHQLGWRSNGPWWLDNGPRLSCVLHQFTQVANPDFFLKMVPLLDGGDDVGMVLSPQSFHNLRKHADIFNHANVQFWEYAQHGYDAVNFISCTGASSYC